MPSIFVRALVEREVKYLQVNAHVRYTEDAKIKGVPDSSGILMPFLSNGIWKPLIDIEFGRVVNWPKGLTADVHYKVCDAGSYALLDYEHDEVVSYEGYVPPILYPGGSGFGDYIIMKIDEEGFIENWKLDLEVFEELVQ